MGFFNFWPSICMGFIKQGLKKVGKRVVTAAVVTTLGLSAATAAAAVIGVTATVGAVVGMGAQYYRAA